MGNGYLGRQTPNITSSILPQLYMLGMTSHIMGYPCGRLGSVFPAVLHPSSMCTPSLLAGGVRGEAEQAALCKSCSEIANTGLY